ncbi:MAG TPA: hypothetical protein VIV60_01815, partial [Polyangiaceae bacterium]
VTWLRPDGTELREEDWTSATEHCLGMLIRGDVPELLDELGHPLQEASLLVFFNASHRSKAYTIPKFAHPGTWRELLNTAQQPRRLGKVNTLSCAPHALNLLSYEWITG